MVLMTDGHDSGNTDPAGEAALAAEAGITMFVVAVDVTSAASPTCDNSDFWPSCIDEATMLQVAGAPERLFVVNTFESLTDTVQHDVLAGIGIPCATDATLKLELDKEPIAVPAVSSGEVEISGPTVTWTMGSVGDSANMTFAVDYCQCEDQRATVEFIASATYTDDEANHPSLLGLLDLTAQITELCPTPGEVGVFPSAWARRSSLFRKEGACSLLTFGFLRRAGGVMSLFSTYCCRQESVSGPRCSCRG